VATEIRNLKELYECHSSSVYRYLLHISGDKSVAEDLTGETFYRAVLAIDSYRGEGSVRAWLLRIARNLYLGRIRQEDRMESLEELQEGGMEFPSQVSSPEAEMLQQDQQGLLIRALSYLTETDRTILLLSAQEEMSCREIADVLSISVAAVKVRTYRARRRLIDHLRNLDHEFIKRHMGHSVRPREDGNVEM
jgi:RNA polymerase sigma factor (SigM family)